MAMQAHEIEDLIRLAFPDAKISIEDLRGDGDHYSCMVESAAFLGCLLYTSPSPRDVEESRMPSSA